MIPGLSQAEWTQLMRFLSGELSPEEEVAFTKALSANPVLRQERDLLGAAWRATVIDEGVTPAELAADRARVLERIRRPSSVLASQQLGRSASSRSPARMVRTAMSQSAEHWRAIWSIGAGALVVAAVCVLYMWQHTFGVGVDQSAITHIYKTAVAQEAVVTLSDSTRVTLAPQTTLVVSQDFGRATRTVTLTGEAYFDVANTSRGVPFLVHTGTVVTRVLGTAFDLKHYTSDRDVRIAVTTGKVAIGGRQAIVLTAGGIGHVTDSTALATTEHDLSLYDGWTNGALAFRWTPVPDMLETVGRWYGVQFQLADSSLAGRHVTATFANGEPRADALALLSTVLNVSLTFDVLSDGTTRVTLHHKHDTSYVAPTRHMLQDSFDITTAEVGR